MQERQVTIGTRPTTSIEPFMVMATQNPVEQEGTYPLPEAQVDRFMMHVVVGYPTREQEREIMERMTQAKLRRPGQRVDEADSLIGRPRSASTDAILGARDAIEPHHRGREDQRLHHRRGRRDA